MAKLVRSLLDADSPVQQADETTCPPEGAAAVISFIVCTRNRLARLKACVQSIDDACQCSSGVAVELVVVDNGSTDGTAEWLAEIAETRNLPIRYVSEPRIGLAVARNIGLENARGSILVFIDDDCTIHLDYMRDLRRHYATDERCVIRGGRVELGDPDDLPFTIKRSRKRASFTSNVHPGGFVLGCNMTMHRDVVTRVGHFDERFGAGGPLRAAEDTDYLVRAFQLGIPIEYVPDMMVFHHHGRNSREAVEALHRNYNLGNGGLYLKHGRAAPWLLRHFYWTLRAAFKELFGGPPFDPELRLSHWPIVITNLFGALRLAGLLLMRHPERRRASQAQSTQVLSETR
jgi:glycosyltransferase involved in cell wall biosynthesis